MRKVSGINSAGIRGLTETKHKPSISARSQRRYSQKEYLSVIRKKDLKWQLFKTIGVKSCKKKRLRQNLAIGLILIILIAQMIIK